MDQTLASNTTHTGAPKALSLQKVAPRSLNNLRYQVSNRTGSLYDSCNFQGQIQIRSLRYQASSQDKRVQQQLTNSLQQNQQPYTPLLNKQQSYQAVGLYLHKIDKTVNRKLLSKIMQTQLASQPLSTRSNNKDTQPGSFFTSMMNIQPSLNKTTFSQFSQRRNTDKHNILHDNSNQLYNQNTDKHNILHDNSNQLYIQDNSSQQLLQDISGQQLDKWNTQVMQEEEIRQQYRFKLPVVVQSLESSNGFLHVNEGFNQSLHYLHEQLAGLKNELNKVKKAKEEVKCELQSLKTKNNLFLDSIQEQYPPDSLLKKYQQILQDNFAQGKQYQFKHSKDIGMFMKEWKRVESKIESQLESVRKMETKLFGMPFYELQTDEPIDYSYIRIEQLDAENPHFKTTNQQQMQIQQSIIH